MTAYVDESLSRSGAGLYMVAAAVVVGPQVGDQRAEVQKVLRGSQDRFHWREAGEAQRQDMMKIIDDLGVHVLGYVCTPLPARQERARALCIGSLVWDLREHRIDDVVFESREPHNDRRDAKVIEDARRSRRASRELAYDFKRPREEPLLWVADALAGALSAREVGDPRYVEMLSAATISMRRIAP